MSRGLWYGLSAYALWGLFPIYFKRIGFVPADQIIAHRIIWSFLLLCGVLFVRGRHRGWQPVGRPAARVVGVYTMAAVLIAVNWFIYVWAVAHAFIVETSLGYFITPLVNVVIGVLVLGEQLRRVQWIAVALAAVGVLYLSAVYGDVPWIALGLAVSFGTYGLVKKKAPLDAVSGLGLETGLLCLPALAFLILAEARGTGAFLGLDVRAQWLVVAAGPITTLPLVLFAAAVQRVPLSAIGILQFIAPTVQFLLGVFVYREPFHHQQLIGFVLVWAAVVLFGADVLRQRRAAESTVLTRPSTSLGAP